MDFYIHIKKRKNQQRQLTFTRQEKEQSEEAVDFYTTRKVRIRKGSRFLHDKKRKNQQRQWIFTRQEKEESAEAVDFYTTRKGRISRGS